MLNLCRVCQSRNIIVADSRQPKTKNYVYRRRKCADCGEAFSTLEIREDDLEDKYVSKKFSAPKKFQTFEEKFRKAVSQYVKSLDEKGQVDFFEDIT